MIGQNEDRVVITSEQSGFCNMVNNYITLNNDDICIVERTETSVNVITKHVYLKKNVKTINVALTPDPYPHWTIK